ncbi:PepSY domain-containing protein [Roseospira visakhapatnamensis]|uniref:PepSY domain-containing protein n=1 Tax=Roseospira visakhapatnamensis TaxID=390880 RepID=A0A7W6RCB4_9PROT|nr:PepSY domain-containing protein [Roseospira visakhapatnamensis]MBB4265899.1 hypothetical protein [Roseospira visakhapatnamensis]
MRPVLILSCVALGLAATPALASPDDLRPRPLATQGVPWLSVSEIADLVASRGLTVRAVEAERSVYEVKAIDANGQRLELAVDPVTGDILAREFDD